MKLNSLEQHRDLVLQPNKVSRAAYKCDSTERKLLYFATAKLENSFLTEGDVVVRRYTACFKIGEMLRALGMNNIASNRKRIREAIKTIAKQTITVLETEKKLVVMNWLQKAVYDEDENKVVLTFTDDVGMYLQDLKEQFSSLDFKTIGAIKSYYAMRYYEIALSYEGFKGQDGNQPHSWFFDLDLERLRIMFEIKDSAYRGRIDNITEKAVKQPIRELNAVNPRFRIDIERLKKGRTLVGYRFICTDLAHSNPVCDTELDSKIALDDIERLKQKYFAEYAKRLAERAQSRQPYESLAMIDFEIFEQMKSEGFEI
jgi:plasmid replication initiation protein